MITLRFPDRFTLRRLVRWLALLGLTIERKDKNGAWLVKELSGEPRIERQGFPLCSIEDCDHAAVVTVGQVLYCSTHAREAIGREYTA